MAILSRPRLLAQERLDLEDWNTLLSALRTDAKLWNKQFLSGENYILKGFTVTGLGLKAATIEMDNATLIHGENTSDFSWFTAESSPTDIVIPDADLTDGVRNYVELQLVNQDGTPVTKAFWDSSASGGDGAEFNQSVNTVTDLVVQAVTRTGGFSGSGDKIPLAIIDTDGTGDIKLILDKRPLFFRLGTASDATAEFSWGSQVEPPFTVVLTGGAGTYTVGETVTFSSGATATVVTGGTTNITIKLPSSDSMATGDTLVGGDSGASRTVDTLIESFTGADKDIDDIRELIQALMTEIKRLKGTAFWHEIGVGSITGINNFINSMMTQISANARISWDGSAVSITDDNGGPADADVLGRIRFWTQTTDIDLTRQDGTGGSSTVAVADGEILFIELPTSGNRSISGTGSGSTNYQVVARGSFEANDQNYWICFREGTKLYTRGMGELESGESAQLSDNINQNILTAIGLTSETANPSYSSNIRGTAAESVIARSGVMTNALGDYQEDRSAYLRSDAEVTWTGTELQFTTDLILEIINTKSGTLTQHKIALADSPLAVADGESLYINIDRTTASETLTAINSGATPIPAQIQAQKDVFVLFRRQDAVGVAYLHIPLHKQVLSAGQTVRLGASGAGDAAAGGGGGELVDLSFKTRLFDDLSAAQDVSVPVDVAATKTTATHSPANESYRIEYDSTESSVVTILSTQLKLSATPTFTVVIGDMLISGSEARRITTLGSINSDGGSTTPFTIESAFSSSVVGSLGRVLNNSAFTDPADTDLHFYNLVTDGNDDVTHANPSNLTNNGTTPFTGLSVQGVANGAALLNGSTQFFSSTDNDFDIAALTSYSMGGWFAADDWTPSSGETMISHGVAASNVADIEIDVSGDIFFTFRRVGGGSATTAVTNPGFVNGTYHHFAMVWDKDALLVSFYIDGLLVATDADETGNQVVVSPLFEIGAENGSAHFAGRVQDSFMNIGKAFSAAEILTLHDFAFYRGVAPSILTDDAFIIPGDTDLHYYELDSGNTINDAASGDPKALTNIGTITFTDTPNHGSLDVAALDGSSQHFLSNDSAFNLAAATSLSMGGWFNSDDWTPASSAVLISLTETGFFSSTVLVQTDGDIQFFFRDSGDVQQSFIVTNPGFTNGTWHHVGYVWDSVSGVITGYLDGLPVGTMSHANNLAMETTIEFNIGAFFGNNNNFAGSVQDCFCNIGKAYSDRELLAIFDHATLGARAASTASQVVHTVDLNDFDNNGLGLAANDRFTGNITEALIGYSDSTTLDDIIPDLGTVAVVGFQASADDVTYGAVRTRPLDLDVDDTVYSLGGTGSNLLVRFFANKTSGSGQVNLLDYKAFFHRDLQTVSGNVGESAYFLNGFSIINAVHSVIGNKSRLTLDWGYPRGILAGTTASALRVSINGQNIPRKVAGSTDDTAAFFIEIDGNTIEFDQDYTSLGVSIEVELPVSTFDSTNVNNTDISRLLELITRKDGNLGFSLVNGKFLITQANGDGLSSTVPGYINVNSVTDGRSKLIKITGTDHFFIDDTGASDIIGEEFGATAGRAWGFDRMFAVYAVNLDDTEAGVEFAISPNWNAKVSPITTNIGFRGTPAATPSDSNFFFLTATDVTATHDAKPCVRVGFIRMQMSASDDWTVSALDHSQGDGIRQELPGIDYRMPLGQNGAEPNNYFTTTAAPFVDTPANMSYHYRPLSDGTVYIYMTTRGAGNMNDGSDSAQTTLALPYPFKSEAGASGNRLIAGAYFITGHSVVNGILTFFFNADALSVAGLTGQTQQTIVNSQWDNTANSIQVQCTYRVFEE